MSYQLRSSHCLLLPHLLLSHRDTFLSSILRRIQRRMTRADYPADRGDDRDDEEPSDDDDDDDDDDRGGGALSSCRPFAAVAYSAD
ncbi:hypothetical protein Tco_0607558, partial [Tanacetum coccineum]